MANTDNIQVALRIRPLVPSEISRGCKSSLEVHKELNQVHILSSEKSFTYNHVFDSEADQDVFYKTTVEPMVPKLFEGYNITILAYGQTGSGKTHSMGTAYDGTGEMGIIPRAVTDIFNYVNDNFSYDFTITVSFMELYQEILYDLLSTKPREQCAVDIREDIHKGIFIPGLTEEPVTSSAATLECLVKGSNGRATASTNMNAQSSRSHAIFTINICMQKKGTGEGSKTARFSLVDLAGSERSKKTGATGQTFKEGININRGLLALGNVISALGDEKGQGGFICYRDSNLTRLLKDSLGGNSITLMIACVSPADYNVEETISTLRYADRARKIKNKPVVNQDPKAAEINRLNKLVQQLRLEMVGQGGPIICQAELELLKKSNTDLKLKNNHLTMKLSITLNENAVLLERQMIMQSANDGLSEKLNGLNDEHHTTLDHMNASLEIGNMEAAKEHYATLKGIHSHYLELKNDLKKNEDEIRKHEISIAKSSTPSEPTSEVEINERQETYTAQQMAMNMQLQEVTKMLAQKEDLALQIAQNTCHMVDYNELADNEEKINALEKEKDELLQQLKSVQLNQTKGPAPSNKLAEQRRKRVQELEGQLHDLKRKVQEQARLIKLKEKDEQKIKQLHNEIQNIKTNKVKLIKNMRQESEKFRTWKLQRERELSKLKDQDRKRQNQMNKMEMIHNRQQNVLKRKVEEAAAINKRLKDALALRKAAQDTKMNGKIERFGPWVQRELELFVSTIDAQTTLNVLMEDRATVQNQLENLRQEPDVNATAIAGLVDDLELRSTQIQELQQKILDSEEESKCKSRFDNVQTMAEAKYTLSALFNLTAQRESEIKRRDMDKEYKINELQATQAETSTKLAAMEEKLENLNQIHSDDLSNIARENEEKISVLLRQLRGIEVKSVDEEVKQRCAIQLDTISRLEDENAKLQEKISSLVSAHLAEKNQINTEESNESELSKENVYKVPKKVAKRSKPVAAALDGTFIKEIDDNIIPGTPTANMDDSMYDEEKDKARDPDWRKTPLARRLHKMRVAEERYGHRENLKRTTQGGCNCKSSCSTRTCGCKKFNNECGEKCNCKTSLCINRGNAGDTREVDKDHTNSSFDKDDSVSFIKSRPLQPDNEETIEDGNDVVPKRKRTRKLFSR